MSILLKFKWMEEGDKTLFYCKQPMNSRDEANEEIAEIVAWLRKAYRRHDQYSYRLQRSDATTIHQVLDVRNGAVVVEDSTTTFGPWMLDFEISIASDVRELFALAFQVSDDRDQTRELVVVPDSHPRRQVRRVPSH